MKKINYLFLSVLFIFLLAAEVVLAGGGKRNGTAGATELLIPVGARGIAMGGSTIMDARGADAIYWNPANLARADYSTDVILSHMMYIADIGVSYGAVGTTIEGFGSVGFSIKSLSFGDINKTTIENEHGTGETYSPQYLVIGATYSSMLSDRIAVGLTVNYISEQIDLVSASGMAFNIGLSYANIANIEGLSMGLVVKNLGAQMQFDGSGLYINAESPDFNRPQQSYKIESASFELPSLFEIGLGYQLSINRENNVLIQTLFQNNNFDGDTYKVGAEYGFNNMVFFRGGYSVSPELNSDQNVFGWTLGAGLNYAIEGMNVKFDYAYQDVKHFDDGNHIFTVGLGL